MTAPVAIHPAATVIVLRDAASGPEVFMVRRHHAIAFMAGAHVFPGGRVDPADVDTDDSWCDVPARSTDVPPTRFLVAALRELFEEAGILLARDDSGALVSLMAAGASERFERYRRELHDGQRTLRDVVQREGLRLALDAVTPFAHWVTPPIETRRFDTWFFVAGLPDRQQPTPDRLESVDGQWIAPTQALALAANGAINLPPPTWATLREIEPFETAAADIDAAASRQIVERQPVVVGDTEPRLILLPGDRDHPVREVVPFETRFVWVDERWTPETVRR